MQGLWVLDTVKFICAPYVDYVACSVSSCDAIKLHKSP